MDTAEIAKTNDEVTIVCCVERGRIEKQTLLMLEMLRRSGGSLGRSRVLAVMPRRGRRLPSETLAALESFGAEVHDASGWNRLPWYNLYAKIAAARLAEELATTPVIAWLDSDVLIFDPLVELGLPHGDDFTARREWLPPAVLDESSVYLDHWKFSCDVLGMKWDDVPWIPADGLDKPQRLMFNSGVFAFRRGLGFAEAFADCTERLIRAGVAYGHGAYWHNEQHSLMFAMLRLGLRWRELPRSENHMIFNAQIDGEHAAPSCAEARLVHYSHSMDAPYWPRFLARLRRERPENLDWLAEHGPIENERVPRHPYALALKFSRNLRSRMQSKRSIRAVHEWKARQA